VSFPAPAGRVEFSHVYFRYPGADEDALSDISFVAEGGETTAIIGSTGSGKSTILNLILRFYEVSQGSIAVDGADIRTVTLQALRA
jgi:ATP-binding cassette subfamily B protein